MEKYIVDRFEEGYLVLEKETGETIDVPKEEIPDAQKGDVVIFENGKYTVNKEETIARKKIIAEKLRKLFEKK